MSLNKMHGEGWYFKPPQYEKERRQTSLFLATQFYRTAMRHATKALKIYVEENDYAEEVALHAGVAVEAWAKLSLVCESPILLLPDRLGPNTIELLSGKRRLSEKVSFQTVAGDEACKRLKLIQRDFPYSSDYKKDLFEKRNAAAHGAEVTDDDSRRALQCMIRLVNWIWCNDIQIKGGEPYALWRPHEELARQLDIEHIEEQAARALERIATARRTYEEQFSHVDHEQLRSVLAASAKPPAEPGDGFRYIARDCPACGNIGWLYCQEVTESSSSDGALECPPGYSVMTPYSIDCQICGLDLGFVGLEQVGLSDDFLVTK